MTVESTIFPAQIELDVVTNGIARVLVHSNVVGILRDGVQIYQYDETVFNDIQIPLSYTVGGVTTTISSRADVETYLSTISTELLNLALGTKLNM